MTRFARPRPILGLVSLALMGLAVLAGAVALVLPRLVELDAQVAVLADAGEAARRSAETARALEGLRGLGRQIRHAPAGPAGTHARQLALARLQVLAADPMMRDRLTDGEAAALTKAVAGLRDLAALRRTQTPGAEEIAARIEALDALSAQDPGASATTPRARQMRRLVAVLRQVQEAAPAAVMFLERQARRLAADAIAAPGLPVGVAGSDLKGRAEAALAAIEAAMDVPRLQVAYRTARLRADRLWAEADTAIAGVADALFGKMATPQRRAADALSDAGTRLTAALVAVLAAAGALWVWALSAGLGGHAIPLGRLAERARQGLGAASPRKARPGARAWAVLDDAITAAAEGQSRRYSLERRFARLEQDADALRTALLGAASEAAGGRAAAAVLAAWTDRQARIRGDLDGLQSAAHWLADLMQEAGAGSPESPTRLQARRDRLDQCAQRLRQSVTEAEALLAPLAPLVGAARTDLPDTEPLGALLDGLGGALADHLAARNVALRVTRPDHVPAADDAEVLAAVVFYAIEAAALRAEAGPDQGRSRDGAALAAGVVQVELSVGPAPTTAGGGLRLTISDDGPALSGAARAALMSGTSADRRAGAVHPLADALRDAPDAAALLLADGLAQAVSGRPLAVLGDDEEGVTVVVDWPPGTASRW